MNYEHREESKVVPGLWVATRKAELCGTERQNSKEE